MARILGHIIEIDPTLEQKEVFRKHGEAARIAYNDFLVGSEVNYQYSLGHSMNELYRLYNKSKFELHPWFKECAQVVVDNALSNAKEALKNFFNPKLNHKYPSLKRKGSPARFSLRLDQRKNPISENEHRPKYPTLNLPRVMGSVTMLENLRYPDTWKVGKGTVFERAKRWFISIPHYAPDEDRRCGTGKCAIDLGVKTFATIVYDDGNYEKIEAPRPLLALERKRKRLSKELSRRKSPRRTKGEPRVRPANRWDKTKEKLANVLMRSSNIRKDWLHKLSHRLTAQVSQINVETLTVQGWMALWGQKVGDLGIYEFTRQLEYKMGWRQGKLIKANRDFPSSKLCSVCGEKNIELTLADRHWTCRYCGTSHDRDVNAATNLLKL